MKIALVTGASRGIGRSTAVLLSKQGYQVVATYNKSEEQAKALIEHNIDIIPCDVSKTEDLDRLYEHIISKYHKLDLVVNNAGISYEGLLQDMNVNSINSVINTNFLSVVYSCKLAAQIMVKQHYGNIINISSVWGIVGASYESLYSATKGGIITLTKSLAKELGTSNIRVNAISPGVIKTDMLNCYTPQDIETLKQETPLMDIGTTEDIANAVAFLSSENSRFITGHNLVIDGGFTL